MLRHGQLLIPAQPVAAGVLGGGGGYVGPLDLVPGAAAAYSVARKLRSAYSAALVRIREDAGNTEQNFSATAANVLDTAAVTAFLAGANGLVVTPFDQSTNGRDFTQATTTKQATYSATAQNSKPGMVGADGQGYTRTGVDLGTVHTLIAVVDLTNNNDAAMAAGTNSLLPYVNSTSLLYRTESSHSATFTVTDPMGKSLLVIVRNGTAVSLYRNGTQVGTTQTLAADSASTLSGLMCRGDAAAWFMTGDLLEYMAWPVAFSTAQRQALESDINAFYALY